MIVLWKSTAPVTYLDASLLALNAARSGLAVSLHRSKYTFEPHLGAANFTFQQFFDIQG